jgi:hypothetical protein
MAAWWHPQCQVCSLLPPGAAAGSDMYTFGLPDPTGPCLPDGGCSFTCEDADRKCARNLCRSFPAGIVLEFQHAYVHASGRLGAWRFCFGSLATDAEKTLSAPVFAALKVVAIKPPAPLQGEYGSCMMEYDLAIPPRHVLHFGSWVVRGADTARQAMVRVHNVWRSATRPPPSCQVGVKQHRGSEGVFVV